MRREAVADKIQALKKNAIRITQEKQWEARLGGRHESGWTSTSVKGNISLSGPLCSEKLGLLGVETYMYFQRTEDKG